METKWRETSRALCDHQVSLRLKKSKKLLLDQWCFMMKILRWMCGVIRRDIEINVFICEQLDVASIKDKMRESLR